MHGPFMLPKTPPARRRPPSAIAPAAAPAAAQSSGRRTRGAEFSLSTALLSPAFTPRRGDVDGLVELVLRGEAPAAAVAPALLRIGPPAFAQLLVRLRRDDLQGSARATLVRLLGRLARPEEPTELQALLELTRDPDPPAARNAIAMLGRLPTTSPAMHAVEPVLLALWAERPRPEDRRALAEALGKLGGAAALAVLRAAQEDKDAEPLLQQVLARAVLRLTRTALRPAGTLAALAAEVALPQLREVTFWCRAGLEPVLAEELSARGLAPAGAPLRLEPSTQLGEPGRVTLRTARPLGELLAARTATELALPLRPPGPPAAPAREPDEAALVERVATCLTSSPTVQLLRALTRGPLRYRLHFAAMGHRRALVWRIAAAVSSRCPELYNDPKESPWELRIGGPPSAPARLELVPRQLPDPRFAYRLGDVPAASHPSLAAALARLCAARPGDVVWDPFVGSASELVEVALLARRPGALPHLVGSDLSAAALATAAANAAAAGVTLRLQLGDALGPPPPGLTRIITNPPMGRRVRRGEVTELLARFAAHAARALPPGGQLTWVSPQPQRTTPVLEAGGLTLVRHHAIDMNGFWARLEVWVKR